MERGLCVEVSLTKTCIQLRFCFEFYRPDFFILTPRDCLEKYITNAHWADPGRLVVASIAHDVDGPIGNCPDRAKPSVLAFDRFCGRFPCGQKLVHCGERCSKKKGNSPWGNLLRTVRRSLQAATIIQHPDILALAAMPRPTLSPSYATCISHCRPRAPATRYHEPTTNSV